MSDLENNLIDAISSGDLAKIKIHLKDGADINGKDRNERTPLYMAVAYSKAEIFDYLLEHGARADLPVHGKSPLQWAREGQKSYFIDRLEKANLAQLVKETPEWSLFGTSKLARVEISPVLERKLTEIFNFESRDRMVIVENLKTGAEKIMPLESFDTLPEETLRKLFQKLTELGGKADEGMVFRRSILDKKQSPLKPE
ncbi:MAG: ankyrin repeat domain-containing protein [Alphaproteobacteria bacterium]|nr:ankyrin repeat domain-containing protein [Alphaproteobacteria bacterium]